MLPEVGITAVCPGPFIPHSDRWRQEGPFVRGVGYCGIGGKGIGGPVERLGDSKC